MARVKGGTVAHTRRKKILKQAEGYFGSKHILFKTAKEQLLHSYHYAYVSRRTAKSDFRKLWIRRISAASKVNGISYSRLIDGLNKSGVKINRKMLAEMAISDPESFKGLCESAKKASAPKAAK
jgi:large subunit ribosomal protein L20